MLLQIFLVFFYIFPSNIFCSNILILTPIGTRSHISIFVPLVQILASNGHKVDFVSVSKSNYVHENVTELVPLDEEKISTNFGNPFEHKNVGKIRSLTKWESGPIVSACHQMYQDPNFQNLIQRKNYFDLVLINGLHNNCLDGILVKLKCPFIIVSALPAQFFVTERVGSRLPPSFVPFSLLDLSDQMNFFDRVQNFVVNSLLSLLYWQKRCKHFEEIYRQYLGQDLPGVYEIENEASLILSNGHQLLTFSRPHLPQIIEIGGIHCRDPKPLPKDLEDFVSGPEGFIYFSFGSLIREKDMPGKAMETFLKVFSKLKQNIMWKFDGHIDNLPKNVKLVKWSPQQDLLGHKSIKLFITHGGLFSFEESAYHAVPLLGVPVFIDQEQNLRQAVKLGYALTLDILDMDEDQLFHTINRLINEPQFASNAKKVSRIFRDQLDTPAERALYWMEYVMRHKGAQHLNSPAKDLNYFQYNSWDVIGLLCGILASTVIILKKIVSWLICIIFVKKIKKD